MKRLWLVQVAQGQEHIEADEVETTESGALVFYRCASRRESERTLILALSSSEWRRCQLETEE